MLAICGSPFGVIGCDHLFGEKPSRRPVTRSWPFIAGITTSVMSRWISPVCSRARRRALSGVPASSTVASCRAPNESLRD